MNTVASTHVVLLEAGAIGVLPAALLVRDPSVKLSVAADDLYQLHLNKLHV